MSWEDPATRAQVLGELQSAVQPGAIDPHARWACASGFAGYKPVRDPAGKRLVPLMLELEPTATAAERAALVALTRAPSLYASGSSPFMTGLMRADDLPVLQTQPGLKRWRMGLPQVVRQLVLEDARLGPFAQPWAPAVRPMLGIIDHGIAFGHRAFRRRREPGKTRIAAFWNQEIDKSVLPRWLPVPEFGYGSMLTDAVINHAIATMADDDERFYRAFSYEPACHRVSHGTHVLDLAAGYPHPLRPRGGDFGAWDGCAADAPIVAVQLPYRPNKDTSGAGLGVHTLDALHFIAALAGPERPVVINLSDGAYGGPHDGSSLTERAIDDFLFHHPRVQLVVAAGNGADKHLHARSDASLAPGQACQVDWQVLPDDATDSFCEIWLDTAVAAGQAELTLEPPGPIPPVTVPLGQTRMWLPAPGEPAIAMVASTLDSPNAPGRMGWLVALGRTSRLADDGAAGPPVPHGRWRITVRNTGHAAGFGVRGYVERDEPVINDKGPRRQPRWVAVPGGGMPVAAERTLSSLAGCGEAFVVGGRFRRGTVWDGGAPSGRTDVPAYVSRGPGRVPGHPNIGPDAVAPSDDSPALPGLRAAANRSGTTARFSGTSVAAPLVARRLVNLIAGGITDRRDLQARLAAPLVPGEEPADSPCAADLI
jgi:Subtilase family